MTVDSAYFIRQYNEDGETVYRFFTESIGDTAMQVWKVAPDGTRMQLATNEYSIAYDLSQTPTFIGGTITLVTPLEAGYLLSVERKTPIVNDLVVTSDVRFPAEEFEYMMDKICFIQQEIEGHFCDCRNSGGDIPVPDEVCKIYTCDIMQLTAEKYGADFWPLMEKNYKSGPFIDKARTPIGTWPNPNRPGSDWNHYEWDGPAGLGYGNEQSTNLGGWTWASADNNNLVYTEAMSTLDMNPCIDPVSPEMMWHEGQSAFWWFRRGSEDFGYSISDTAKRWQRHGILQSGIYTRFNATASVLANTGATYQTRDSSGNVDSGSWGLQLTRWNQTTGGETAGDLTLRQGQDVLFRIANTPGGYNNTPLFVGVIFDMDYENRRHVRNAPGDSGTRANYICEIDYIGYVRVADFDGTFDVSLNFSGTLDNDQTFGESGSASDPAYILPEDRKWKVNEEEYSFGGGPVEHGVHSLTAFQQKTPINAIDEMLDAWRQQMDDYVDPNPECIPRCLTYSCDTYDLAIGAVSGIDFWPMNDTTADTMGAKYGNWALYWGSREVDEYPVPDQPTLYSSCADGANPGGQNARSMLCSYQTGIWDWTGSATTNISTNQCAWGAIIEPKTAGDNTQTLLYIAWQNTNVCVMWLYIESGTDLRVRVRRSTGLDTSQTVSGIFTLDQPSNIAFTMDWTTNDPVVVVYKDFVAQATLTFTGTGAWTGGPTTSSRFTLCMNADGQGDGGTGECYVEAMWWLDRQLTAQELADLKAGWDRNQTDYVDPDPTCFPNNQNP